MKRYALLGGSFLVTFALLVSVWMIGTGRSPLGGLVATPSAPPTAAPTAAPVATAIPTATPSPTATPTGTPSPSPTPTLLPATPSPSPAPLRTVPPSFEPPPSSRPGDSQTYTLTGAQYSSYQIPEAASLLLNGDALVMRTTSESDDALWVTYRVQPGLLPAGATVHSVSVAICGYGSGQFWEVYGPTGSVPHEYEVVPPDADGCWHFRDALTNDVSAVAGTMLESTMVIESVVFTVTFAG